VDDVMDSLLKEGETKTDLNRSRPQHKQIWGTLQGKDAALNRLQNEVSKRTGEHIQHKVMLCDGDKSLQNHLTTRFSDFTLILDFIHAYEYLWQVANTLYGEDDPARHSWILVHTRHLLNGQTHDLATAFRQLAEAKGRTTSQQKVLRKVANYFENNQAYMDYATYLQKGWPIASGVIEGVCRHFVKDRMELSGMRWSIDGAENLLHLRAVAENGDWETYHYFRKQQRQKRLYKRDWPEEIPLQVLSRPAKRLPKTPAISENTHTIIAKQNYAQLPLAI
jgi:hypothetical protein